MFSEDIEGVQIESGKPPLHGKRNELITKKKAETKCWCSRKGTVLHVKHIVCCCKKENLEIDVHHDIVVNILLNNILVQRGLVAHEQSWVERKMVRTETDQITVGTEHVRSDEWKYKGRVRGARLKPDMVWVR